MGTRIPGTAAATRRARGLTCAWTLVTTALLIAGAAGVPARAEPTPSPTSASSSATATPSASASATPSATASATPTATPSPTPTPSTGCPPNTATVTYLVSGKTCIGTERVAATYVDDRPAYTCPEGFVPAGAVKPNAVCRSSSDPDVTEQPIRVDLFECPPGFTSMDPLLTEASDCTRTVIVPLQLPGKGTVERVPGAVSAGGGGSDSGPLPWPAIALFAVGLATALSMSVRLIATRLVVKG